MALYARLSLTCLLLVGCAEGHNVPDAEVELPDSRPGDRCSVPNVECCNGADDDGDSLIDEGTAEELCGTIDNGSPRCDNLAGCSIDDCSAGFADLDGEFGTGCECGIEPSETESALCDDAIDIGTLADSGEMAEISGVIAPVGDSDWFRVTATDSADTTCDTYHFRAQFTSNPGNQYTMAVMRGGCLGTSVCDSGDDMQWNTNFTMNGVSGECPCTTAAARMSGVALCADDTSEFIITVTRISGATATCDNYTIEISNGIY